MKITGYTSIFRLKEYIEFQKYLGHPIIGDYYLFLKKKLKQIKTVKLLKILFSILLEKKNLIQTILQKTRTSFHKCFK